MGLIFFLSSRGELGLPLRGHDLIRDALAKLAHVIEYGGLALLTRCVLRQCGAGSRWSSVAAVLFAALFGASDEWHQTFVPGREARATDVMIDAAGAALAMWLAAWVGRLKVSRLKEDE